MSIQFLKIAVLVTLANAIGFACNRPEQEIDEGLSDAGVSESALSFGWEARTETGGVGKSGKIDGDALASCIQLYCEQASAPLSRFTCTGCTGAGNQQYVLGIPTVAQRTCEGDIFSSMAAGIKPFSITKPEQGMDFGACIDELAGLPQLTTLELELVADPDKRIFLREMAVSAYTRAARTAIAVAKDSVMRTDAALVTDLGEDGPFFRDTHMVNTPA